MLGDLELSHVYAVVLDLMPPLSGSRLLKRGYIAIRMQSYLLGEALSVFMVNFTVVSFCELPPRDMAISVTAAHPISCICSVIACFVIW